jgi:hypothetical protein
MSEEQKANNNKHTGATALQRSELRKRMEKGENVEPITQNGFYYHMRKIFLLKGIDPEKQGKNFRRNMTNSINKMCKQLRTTREDLKIFASSRAFLYFRGERVPVSLANMEKNITKGTDILIIEKEGACEVWFEYANKQGIALLDTKGFAVEYAKRLSKLSDSHIAMITDFDDSGLLMALNIQDTVSSDIYRIGVDFDIVKELNLKLSDVEERYTPGNAMKKLEKLAFWGEEKKIYERNFYYLREKRIEIDSIMEAAGAEKFWKYVIKKLAKQFPERDYNRSLTIQENIKPEIYYNFVKMLNDKIKEVLKDDIKKIRNELRNHKGIIEDVQAKEQEISDTLQDLVDKHTKLRPLRTKILEIINEFQVKQ